MSGDKALGNSKFDGLRIKTNTTGKIRTFGIVKQQNSIILGEGIRFISKNYRNKTAHSEFVEKKTVEECKDLLLQGEYILWILLYIIK